jgi:sec-independent protein translocase protein TatA
LPQIGPLEILVVLVVALVVFGPRKLPELGRQVGRGYREFREFQQGVRDDIEDAFRDDDDHHDLAGGFDDGPQQIEASRPDPSTRPEPPPADTTS